MAPLPRPLDLLAQRLDALQERAGAELAGDLQELRQLVQQAAAAWPAPPPWYVLHEKLAAIYAVQGVSIYRIFIAAAVVLALPAALRALQAPEWVASVVLVVGVLGARLWKTWRRRR